MRLRRPTALLAIIAGVLLTLVMAAFSLTRPQLLLHLEGKVFDSFIKASPSRPASDSIVIVDLDETSIALLGQWPWPRYRVAQLLEKIRDAKPSAVGLDVLFSEPDRTSLGLLIREIQRDMGVKISLKGPPPETINTDLALANILAAGPFVLGHHFDFASLRGEECVLHALPATVWVKKGGAEENAFFNAPGVVCNLPLLSQAAGASGFFNVTPDSDGIVRRVPLFIKHKGRQYPSLALAVYLKAFGGDTVIDIGRRGVESIRIGEKTIPLDNKGNLIVNYRSTRRAFHHISALSVLNGSIDPSAMRGKIVLFGTTAAGLHELRTTPLDAAHPGVEIHATVVDNLIAGDPIIHPWWGNSLQLILILVPGILLTLLVARARAAWGVAAVVICAIGFWLFSLQLLAQWQIHFPPIMPVATLVFVFTTVVSLRYMESEREIKERTLKLSMTQDAIIQSLASLAETRHHETGGHIQRTRHYIRALAVQLKDHPRFRGFINDSTIDLLFRLAPLHDIGKVGVPDEILLKPTRLSEEEYENMKKHTSYGWETIRLAKNFLGEDYFLQVAEEIILNHHERWDGLGYPRGLRGDETPIPGRLMAVADSYDAIVSPRLYKPSVSHEEAIPLILKLRGTYFDPDVVDAFMAASDEFAAITEQFASSGVEPEPPKGFE